MTRPSRLASPVLVLTSLLATTAGMHSAFLKHEARECETSARQQPERQEHYLSRRDDAIRYSRLYADIALISALGAGYSFYKIAQQRRR